jgi:hypothetical protein
MYIYIYIYICIYKYVTCNNTACAHPSLQDITTCPCYPQCAKCEEKVPGTVNLRRIIPGAAGKACLAQYGSVLLVDASSAFFLDVVCFLAPLPWSCAQRACQPAMSEAICRVVWRNQAALGAASARQAQEHSKPEHTPCTMRAHTHSHERTLVSYTRGTHTCASVRSGSSCHSPHVPRASRHVPPLLTGVLQTRTWRAAT